MMLDLEAIKARCEAATPGEWHTNDQGIIYEVDDSVGFQMWKPTNRHYNDGNPIDDGDFMSNARADIPALVAEVERLRDTLFTFYGTVAVKPTWARQWPHVNALVREALGLE